MSGALGGSEVASALRAVSRLAAVCAQDEAPADVLQLLGEVERLRPALAQRLPSPAGETIVARSWEELCLVLFSHPALPSSLVQPRAGAGGDGAMVPGESPMVYCGVPDAASGLLSTAQAAGKRCEQAEDALAALFRRSARAFLPSGAADLEWLVLGHSHGLPTRLIDFHRSPLAALHAATLGAEDRDGVVWCVDGAACHRSCAAYREWEADAGWWAARGSRAFGRVAGAPRYPPPPGEKVLTLDEACDLLEHSQQGGAAGGADGAATFATPSHAGCDDLSTPLRSGASRGSAAGSVMALGGVGDALVFFEPAASGAGGVPAGAQRMTGTPRLLPRTPGADGGTPRSAAGGTGAQGCGGAVLAMLPDAGTRLDEWLAQRPAAFRRVVVPARLKPSVRARLDEAGFTEKELSPGLEGLCAWLRRVYS